MQLFLVQKSYKHMLASVYKQGCCQIKTSGASWHLYIGDLDFVLYCPIYLYSSWSRTHAIALYGGSSSTGDIAARTLFGKEWVARQYNEPK